MQSIGTFIRAGSVVCFNDVADKPYAFNMEPGGVLGSLIYSFFGGVLE